MHVRPSAGLRPLPPDLWMQTLSGRVYPLLEAQAGDVDWRDVATSLARQCRFNGHTTAFYSVAQHSVLVAQLVDEWIGLRGAAAAPAAAAVAQHQELVGAALAAARRDDRVARRLVLSALLHDAHEAVIGDISTPVAAALKRLGAGDALQLLKTHHDAAIYRAAGLDWPQHAGWRVVIHVADLVLLATERRDLMAPTDGTWPPLPDPAPWRIRPLPDGRAADQFHKRLMELL